MNEESNANKKARAGLQRFSIEGIDRELIRKVRAYAMLEDRLTADILTEAVTLWLEHKQKKTKL